MLSGRVKDRPSNQIPVSLPFQTQGLGWERPLEPAVVKVLSQNRAKFYLTGQSPMFSFAWDFPLVGGQRVKRVGVTRVRASYNLYNVTSLNNTFGYYVSGFVATYLGVQVVRLTPGQYTVAQLAVELQTQLNVDTPPSTSWTVTVSANNPNLFLINFSSLLPGSSDVAFITGFTNTNILFPSTKDFIATALNQPYGLGLRGISLEQALVGSNRAVNFYAHMQAYGVRYFDVCSRTLTMDSKTMCPDLLAPPGMLTRVFLPHPYHGNFDERYGDPMAWVNVEDRPLTNIDLQFFPNQYYMGDPSPWGSDRLFVEVEVTIEF